MPDQAKLKSCWEFRDELKVEASLANTTVPRPCFRPPASTPLTFDFDFDTWDSYTTSESMGANGYWDSYSVTVTSEPYPNLSLTDPLSFSFLWGGQIWGDGTLEPYDGSQSLTFTGDPNGTNYLNVVLDTRSTPYCRLCVPVMGQCDTPEYTDSGGESVPDHRQLHGR